MSTVFQVIHKDYDVGVRMLWRKREATVGTCYFKNPADGNWYGKFVQQDSSLLFTSVANSFLTGADPCAYDETRHENHVPPEGEFTHYEGDMKTQADIEAALSSAAASAPWSDPAEIDITALGGNRGWNKIAPTGSDPRDTTGDTPGNPFAGKSFELASGTGRQTDLQYKFQVYKDRVPFLIKWMEGINIYSGVGSVFDQTTPSVLRTRQMGSGTWDTGWLDLTAASQETRWLDSFLWYIPWLH